MLFPMLIALFFYFSRDEHDDAKHPTSPMTLVCCVDHAVLVVNEPYIELTCSIYEDFELVLDRRDLLSRHHFTYPSFIQVY